MATFAESSGPFFGKPVSVAYVLVASLLLVPAHAQAKQISGSLAIEAGDYYGWRIDVAIPSQIEIEISSTTAPVDILVLDQDNFSKFSDDIEFEYYPDHSILSSTNVTMNFTVLSGTVYIVVDNSDRPHDETAANNSGAVQVEYWIGSTFDLHAVPDEGGQWMINVMIVVLLSSLVFVILFTRYALKSGRSTRGPRQ